MTKNIISLILIVAAFVLGMTLGPQIVSRDDAGVAGEEDGGGEREVLYWVAPMDPNFKRDKPGKSPMGMDLVAVYADEAAGDEVTISPAVENNLGVRTATARVRPLWRRIEATGYVNFDETRISHINTRVQGWIVSLQVDAEGERVSAGDLLFELYSPELVNAQKEYLLARRRGGQQLVASAGEKLRALGMIPSEIRALEQRGSASENIKFVAPQDGIVTSLSVREGMYVQPNKTIMSLADLSSVWLQAEVFESQAEWVAEGQAAEAALDYLPGTEFSGQVDYVYPVLDPKTRTLRVRLRFDNPAERLKPNMYARVSIYGRLKPNALTIPREALIPAPGYDRVVVALGDGRFRVHEVMTGLESGEFIEVLAGIAEGDRIVTSAQFLIDSESSIAGSLQRLGPLDEVPQQRALGRVFASGRVEGLDAERRRLRVSHGPIDALGWPSMTMEFDLRPDVSLEGIEPGQSVHFSLVQEQAGEYVMEQVHSSESGLRQMEQREAGHEPTVGEMPEDAAQSVMAEAVVRGVDAAAGSLRLEHAPIPALGWPAMTMNFTVRDGVELDGLAPGQQIHFVMTRDADGRWLIEQIHVLDSAPSNGGHEHD
jgi:Cu(I)/Ag(I) efflux system membrane fusion protein